MERLKLIYNPFSGNKSFSNELDTYIKVLQEGGFDVNIFRASAPEDVSSHLATAGDFDVILAAGGDGTVSLVINAMMKNGIEAALGIIPCGTANDFARHLGLTDMSAEQLCNTFSERNITLCDIGQANETYFINVCGGGLLAQVGHTVDSGMKDILGKLSYYIKGVSQLPNFSPMQMRIKTASGVIEEELYLYLFLNSPGAGSFDNLAQLADIKDGLLDFFAVKAAPFPEMAKLFIKILSGEHLDEPSVIYLRDSEFEIEALGNDESHCLTSIDGDAGPNLPLKVSVLPNAVRMLTRSGWQNDAGTL